MEDILEEIVGEIWDEYDEVFEEIKQVSENVYIISGKTNVDKVFEIFDMYSESRIKFFDEVIKEWYMRCI